MCALSDFVAGETWVSLRAWLLQIFPALGFMRYPIKFVLLPAFLLPLLAAFGLAGVLAAQPDEKSGLWRRLAGLWVSVSGLIILILWFAWRYPQYDDPYNRWTETFESGLSRLGFFGAHRLAALVDREQHTGSSAKMVAIVFFAGCMA